MSFDPALAKALFLEALELPDPADRPGFLDRKCGEDAELRQRLDQLLAAYDHPAAALDVAQEPPTHPTSPGLDAGPTGAFDVERTASVAEEVAPRDLIGSIVAGRYKLRQEIGEGGMGRVYLAEQLRPVKRQVALKLIKPGMDSRTVLARFESERQALALMDHPNIAKVLDAGSTEHGRPFFVMELVKGIPLTDYCDRHQLDLPARLALFRQICSAVQHAHQKGIIHRDLKPTNILVESHDGKPVPKVIDFGLAKATSGMQLSEHSLFTAFGSVTGTPLYMAPEQATFNALDVDTRADIYALGVILYELLTGSTPIQRGTMQRTALDEMLRVIREDEPPTPSSRISTSEGLPGLAANRHVEPSRLSRLVKGDLDWIVMKALAKERNRRYDSAIGLANDIERFTNHDPVSAGPPTMNYRFRKFVRRHRGQVVAVSLVLLVMVGGIVGTSLGLIQARRQERIAFAEVVEKEKAREAEARQRERAEKRSTQIEKANEILGSIFRQLNPKGAEAAGKPLAVLLGERLDRAAAEIEGDSIGDPVTVARMQITLGRLQLGLGHPVQAIDLIAKARATLASVLGPDHPETLASINDLSLGYRDAGKVDRALALLEEASALRRAKPGSGQPGPRIAGDELPFGRRDDGKVERALPLLEEVLADRKARLGPDHPDTLASMNDLAVIYARGSKADRAVPLLEEVLALRRSRLGPDHPDTLTSMSNLAMGYQSAGRYELAIPMLEQALQLQKERLGPDHPDVLETMNRLGVSYRDGGRLDAALPLLERTLELRRATLRPGHPETLLSMINLAEAYQDAAQPGRALALHAEAAALWKAETGVHSWRHAFALASIGWCLLEERRWSEAEAVLRQALALREAEEPDAWTTDNARSLLGWSLLGQGRLAEAEPLLRGGVEGMKRKKDEMFFRWRKRLPEDLDRLIGLAEATNKPDDVRRWKEERAAWSLHASTAPMPGKK